MVSWPWFRKRVYCLRTMILLLRGQSRLWDEEWKWRVSPQAAAARRTHARRRGVRGTYVLYSSTGLWYRPFKRFGACAMTFLALQTPRVTNTLYRQEIFSHTNLRVQYLVSLFRGLARRGPPSFATHQSKRQDGWKLTNRFQRRISSSRSKVETNRKLRRP